MSATTNPLIASSERMFASIMQNLGDKLLPGSAERIRALIAPGRELPPENVLVERVLDYLEGEHGSRNWRPEVASATGSGGTFALSFTAGLTPLQRALEALPLRPESRKVLGDQLGYDLGRHTAGAAARAIVDRRSDRDFREAHFADNFQIPVSPGEIRVREVLANRFADALAPGERDAYARRFAETSMGLPMADGELVRQLATDLACSGKIPRDDSRREEPIRTAPTPTSTEPAAGGSLVR